MKRKKDAPTSTPGAPVTPTLVLTKRSVASLSEDQLSDAAGGHPNHTCELTCPRTGCGDTCERTCGDTCRGPSCGVSCGRPSCAGTCQLDACTAP